MQSGILSPVFVFMILLIFYEERLIPYMTHFHVYGGFMCYTHLLIQHYFWKQVTGFVYFK